MLSLHLTCFCFPFHFHTHCCTVFRLSECLSLELWKCFKAKILSSSVIWTTYFKPTQKECGWLPSQVAQNLKCPSFPYLFSSSVTSMERDMNVSSTSSVVHWLASLTLTLLGSVHPMPVTIDPVCTADTTAKYSLTFTGMWSQTSFPKQYPIYRPPAQWSPLIGK